MHNWSSKPNPIQAILIYEVDFEKVGLVTYLVNLEFASIEIIFGILILSPSTKDFIIVNFGYIRNI